MTSFKMGILVLSLGLVSLVAMANDTVPTYRVVCAHGNGRIFFSADRACVANIDKNLLFVDYKPMTCNLMVDPKYSEEGSKMIHDAVITLGQATCVITVN